MVKVTINRSVFIFEITKTLCRIKMSCINVTNNHTVEKHNEAMYSIFVTNVVMN